MRIICGTSGYDYQEWVGAERFYPPGLAGRRSEWLTYYASQFPIAELNFTYYGVTSPQQLENMLARTDPRRTVNLLEGEFRPLAGFQFTIKAYAALTHQIDDGWRGHAGKFREDIAPLTESGRLLGVLAQFPPRFHISSEALRYVLALAEALAPNRLIAEFRHADWLRAKPRAELLMHGIVVCGIDAPEAAGMPSAFATDETSVSAGGRPSLAAPVGQASSLPVEDAGKMPAPPASVPFRYLRLHGRREETWWTGDAASRYDYLYSEPQLRKLAARLLKSEMDTIYVMFNNHRHANAAKNARQLQEIVNALLGQGSGTGPRLET